MASLNGQTIASSYEQLLHVDRDGGGNANTLVSVKDGDNDTTFGIKLATNKVEIIPGSDDTNAFEVSQADGTAVFTVNTSAPEVTITDTGANRSAVLKVQGDFDNQTIQGASGNAGGLIVLRNTDSQDGNFSAINFQDANENTLSGILGINASHVNNQGELVFFVRGGLHTDGAEAMRVDHNGKVGIGTSAPNELFHVEGSSPSIRIKASNEGGLAELKLESDQGDDNADLWSLRADPAHEFKIMSNSTGSFSSHAVFRLTETEFAKDVGIGGSPSNLLHLHTDNSSEGILLKSTGNTRNNLIFDANISSASDNIAFIDANWNTTNVARISMFTGTATSPKDDGRIGFATKATGGSLAERMRIESDGKVGIGTTSPNYRFKVEGSEATWLQNISNTASSGNAFCQQLQFTGVSPNNTTSKFQQFVDGGSTVRFEVRSNGGVVNFQSNDADFSDESVKKDITDAPSYLETVNNIKVRNFKYKDQSDDRTLIGVIAQEVEAVDSSLVDGSEELKRVYNKDIMFMMLKAVQELSAKVTELENKLGD